MKVRTFVFGSIGYHYVATTANPLTEGLTVGTAYLKIPLKGWW